MGAAQIIALLAACSNQHAKVTGWLQLASGAWEEVQLILAYNTKRGPRQWRRTAL